MIYTDWSELVALNKTGKPIALGGYPRGGTTFAYRCLGALVRQPWHLEEYFHIFYEFKKNKFGEVVIDTDTIEDKKQQAKKGKGSFEFPDGGWECSNCQNYNFKGRKECFRCKKARSKKDLTGKPKHMLKNE